MDPISTGLAGIALVQKSVDFIKSNISTANDIRDIAGAIDGLFQGEKEVQKQRFGNKSLLGQSKDAAHAVIDAKLAQEKLEEMSILIDNRFGYGTWRAIIAERNKRIQEEKQQIAEAKRRKQKEREKNIEMIKMGSIVIGSVILIVLIAAIIIKAL